MSRHTHAFPLVALLLMALLLPGCRQGPDAVQPGQNSPPTLKSYPRMPAATALPFPTATPIATLEPIPTPLPTWTPLAGQPTPYAAQPGALPDNLPPVVYFVQRSDQPPQVRTLRYAQGTLQGDLTAELSPAALEGKGVDPAIGFGWVYRLSASPDGRYIAVSFRGEGSYEATLILDANGNMYMPYISNFGGSTFLSWIPGSERAVIGRLYAANWGTISFDGSEPVKFPSYLAMEAVVSPDSSRVIFAGNPSSVGIAEKMGSMGLDGSNLTAFPLPDSSNGKSRNLELSPDGETCAFTWDRLSHLYPGTGPIWLVDVNGTNLRALGPDNVQAFNLAWSPDGQTLAVARWENPDLGLPGTIPEPYNLDVVISSLWLVDVETGHERLLLSSEGQFAQWSPEWLPDGKGLVFLSDRSGENNVWFIRTDGTGLQQLTFQGGLVGEIAVLPR